MRKRKWISWWSAPLVLVTGMLTTQFPTQSAGLLKNADFTQRAAGQPTMPSDWEVNHNDRDVWQDVDDDGHSGKDSLCYYSRSERKAAPVTQEVACEPNLEYVLTASLKSDGVLRPLVRVTAPSLEGRVVAQLTSEGQSKWTQFAVGFNIGTSMRMLVQIFADGRHAQGQSAPPGTAKVDDVQVFLASQLPRNQEEPAGLMPKPPGMNIALGQPYTLEPAPNYAYCTDAGDKTQLTDGEYSVGYFWVQKSTVGWTGHPMVQITIDLGQIQPICGVSYNTAAGVAGVGWPRAILVLVSDDGKTYFQAGELVNLSAERGLPEPEGYSLHRFWTDRLRAHGRYVKLVISPGGLYCFVDEVEVYRGADELLSQPQRGEAIRDVAGFFRRTQLRTAIQRRLFADWTTIQKAVKEAKISAQERRGLEQNLEALRAEFSNLADVREETFRAVLPLNELHARLFRVQAALWRAQGRPLLAVWQTPLWDPLTPTAVPEAKAPRARIQVDLMQNEYRAAAFNLTNAGEQELTVKVRIEGLPGGANPNYVTVHEVAWTDTKLGVPVAAALPQAERLQDGYLIRVPSGMTRQVWLTFHPVDVEPGNYSGRIAISQTQNLKPNPKSQTRNVPIRLRIFPFRFPDQPTLHLGGWDYTDTDSAYGVTLKNREALIRHLREHFVDVAWGTSSVMPYATFDATGKMVSEPDYRRFDEWVARWKGARLYYVFLAVSDNFAGARIHTPEFNQRVGLWISAWVKHLKQVGLKPNQLGLLLVDEPTRPEQDEIILAWAQAIEAAEPQVIIWEDPCHSDPWQANRAMMETCDVLCPNRVAFLAAQHSYRDFYVQQREKGRTLNFYSCSGPVRSLDPYTYHRLQAWTCWQYGATGSFFWAFGDNGGGSAWNEYTAPGTCYTPLFLDENSVTPGKHMEAVREGVEDYEYLVMLRERIAQLSEIGHRSEALDAARELLKVAPARVLEATGANNFAWTQPKDRTLADRVRIKVLELLTALKNVK